MPYPETVPQRLRHQIRLAAGLLLAPWLLAVIFYWTAHRLRPAVILALVPGLTVALYLQRQLALHAVGNHRQGEPQRLYPTLGGANWITLLRAGGVVGLAGFLPLAVLHDHWRPALLSWTPGLLYLGIALADLGDGLVARQQDRETVLGKHLDIETDAAGLLAASLVAVAFGRLPAIYLLVGLAYYPFILGIRLRQRRARPVAALRPRPYSRIIAGFQMGLVGMALLPIFTPPFRFAAAYILMTPLLIGFLRDWLVVSGRVATDENQQSTLDRWARSAMSIVLPALRLGLLAFGVLMLTDSPLDGSHPAWQLVGCAGCLLAGLGIAGRSAALSLVLMLGVNRSPFGTAMVAMLLFCTAVALMATGTGKWSLWAPEERFLYRQGKRQTTQTDLTP